MPTGGLNKIRLNIIGSKLENNTSTQRVINYKYFTILHTTLIEQTMFRNEPGHKYQEEVKMCR